jgi:outer membrane biosynthesis protein TonB
MNETVRKALIVGVPLLLAASCGVTVLSVVADEETPVAEPQPTVAATTAAPTPTPTPTPTPEPQPTPAATSEPEPEPTEAEEWRPDQEVDWENHAPTVKFRIDRLGVREDCDGLQEAFDNADANDAAQRNRTGDGNADLMGYIDQWLRHAGCY